jgi:hypothetical protein
MSTNFVRIILLTSLLSVPILAGAGVTAPKTKKVQNIGLVNGVKIVPDKVEVLELRNNTLKERGKVMEETRTWHIKFRQGGDFWPDKEIMIVLNQPIGTGLSGLKVSQKATKFGTDAYRAQHYPKDQGLAHGVTGAFFGYRKTGKDMIDTIIQNDEIRANLQFSKVTNGKVTIVVDLELPGKRTWLKGKFTGVITKL